LDQQVFILQQLKIDFLLGISNSAFIDAHSSTKVHSQEDLDMAIKASEILFGKSTTEDLNSLDEKTLLSVFEGVPQFEISRDRLANLPDVTELLSEASNGVVFTSKGEARRMIKGGGVSINKSRIADPQQKVDFQLLQDKYLLIQKGKKNYYLMKAV